MPIIDKNGFLGADSPILAIEAGQKLDDIICLHNSEKALGIIFASYSDGRGFTLGKRLRQAGYSGKLRAIGPLIPDQFANLIACGFDEIAISDEQFARQPIKQWQDALLAISVSYQGASHLKQSILAKRFGGKLNSVRKS